ncbi:hypothetical protein CLOM_g17156 [Closterium sp. NIES-68]|nr:hypothetical protein CLOM_g17156 [Closterium sp. NIES-68]GJP63172.1 hypothetical protein CLOP_g20241 [Closterium sp. NIES-67]
MARLVLFALLVFFATFVADASPADGTNFVAPILRSDAQLRHPQASRNRRSLMINATPKRDTPCASRMTWWNQTGYTGAKWVTWLPNPTNGCLNFPSAYYPSTTYGSIKIEWYAPTDAMKSDWYFVTCKLIQFYSQRDCNYGVQQLTCPTDRNPPSPSSRSPYPGIRTPLKSVSCQYWQDVSNLYTCPPNSHLDSSWAGAKCYCNKGFAEKNGTCVDVCTPLNCGPNSDCYVANGAGVCNCTEGYRMVNGKCEAVGHSDFLDPHNAARAAVGLPALKWNDTLATAALTWVTQLGTTDTTCHTTTRSTAVPYGQNLLATGGIGQWTPGMVVQSWVDEKAYYTYALLNGGCATGQICSHYIQIVSGASTDVGCASYTCAGAGWQVWACFYSPKGLVKGTYPY